MILLTMCTDKGLLVGHVCKDTEAFTITLHSDIHKLPDPGKFNFLGSGLVEQKVEVLFACCVDLALQAKEGNLDKGCNHFNLNHPFIQAVLNFVTFSI